MIQVVKTRSGPYNESGPDSRDVESLTVGSGPVYVLRNGRLESGTWDRPGQKNITKLYSADGKSITWRAARPGGRSSPTTSPSQSNRDPRGGLAADGLPEAVRSE